MEVQAIDHICHSHGLNAGEVVGISNVGPGGMKLSDHFGLQARLTAN
jgi:endonuclease/exonuclease/phosphatase family metal-dependent hydrolase